MRLLKRRLSGKKALEFEKMPENDLKTLKTPETSEMSKTSKIFSAAAEPHAGCRSRRGRCPGRVTAAAAAVTVATAMAVAQKKSYRVQYCT